MEPGLPGSRHDARGRRPSRSSRHHLRDECRELSSQGRPPATDRGWKDPKIRDNQIHRENVDQRQSERRIALASDNLTRSEEHTSELQSLLRISYAVFCLKKKTHLTKTKITHNQIQYTHIQN